MGKRLVICPICGKEFEAKAANAKYCSTACRQKGKYQRRREWEKESGYLDKQREKMRLYRERVTAEEKAEQEAAEKRKEINRKRQETRRKNLERDKLLQAAEQGDAFARMALAMEESGNTSPEYWEAFKDYDLQYAASWNKESTTTVNGISIHAPQFGLAISMSIEELGHIETHTGLTERIEENAESEL